MRTKEQVRGEVKWASSRYVNEVYGLSRWTVNKLAEAGEIKVAHVGSAKRIEIESVEGYLNRAAK